MKKVLFVSALAAGLASSAHAQLQNSNGATKTQYGTLQSPFGTARNAQATVVPSPSAAVGGGDDCMLPTPLMGQGSFNYDNTTGTTGAEGQAEPGCDKFGSTGIDNDVWFAWTADADGIATINTCGSAVGDTKIAAYDGMGCPTGPALDCNDDTCGFFSEISFGVTAGTTYTLQAGNFPGSAGGPATLDISISGPPAAPTCYSLDDGSTENAIGLTAGGTAAWLQGFDAIGGSDVITEISTAFGSPTGGTGFTNLPGFVAIWDDIDFDPTDATLLYSAPLNSSMELTDNKVSFAVPNIAVNGIFFIGIVLDNPAGTFPAPLDQSTSTGGRVWIVGNTAGPGSLDLANLGANDVPPLDVDSIGFPGVWLLSADGDGCDDTPIGDSYCVSNANSADAAGSSISASGSLSLADMNVSLSASNIPMNQGGLFFFGPAQTNAPFGCGQLCLAGSLVRFPVVFENMGQLNYDVDFGAFGGDLAAIGGTVNFQCWYRDPANAGVCGNTFNTSDGVEVAFTP